MKIGLLDCPLPLLGKKTSLVLNSLIYFWFTPLPLSRRAYVLIERSLIVFADIGKLWLINM